MSDSLTILRQRRDRRQAAQHSAEQRTSRTALGCGFVVSVLAALLILSLVLAYADLTRDLPSVDALPGLLNPPDGALLQPTRIYDRSSQHLLAVLAPADGPRRYIPLNPQNPQHLPQTLADATVAMLDPGFWHHPGYTLSDLSNPELHPTLAQRLASDLLLWNEPPSLRRALRERLLAAQITHQYGRSQVLEWYLNSANYGHYAFGSEAAAQLYFGKSVTELNLAESGVLAAVSQYPSLNPLDAPQVATQRGMEVVHIMQSLELVDKLQADLATGTPVQFAEAPPVQTDPAPAFVDLAFSQLEQLFSRSRLERGGLTITTTLDYDLQLQSDCAVQTQLVRLAGSAATLQTVDGDTCEAARYLSALPPGVSLPGATASALLTDPRSGQVLAVVGEKAPGQERQFLSRHPAGSLMTPFVYLTAFARGSGPASLVWDIPGRTDIQNFDGRYHGPLRLRDALANDYLVPAAQTLDQMGRENVWNTARSFGINYDPATDPLTGDVPLSLLEAGGAYSVFAAQGSLNGQPLGNETFQPVTVLKVETADHAIWLDWSTPQFKAVLTSPLAYLVTDVLSDETARWPSLGNPNPLEIGRPAGAKLGETGSGEAWTVGYTPQRVAVVWLGAGETGSGQSLAPRLAAGLWHGLIQYASQDLPSGNWNMPSGVTRMEVCDPSGLLPTGDCPEVVSEVFLNGNEPQQTDDLYRAFQVNRETGLLATVFTPPQLVESRVFLVVPPDAQEWAKESGIPTPPESYDAIQVPPRNPLVNIGSPEMFSKLSGKVVIAGTAAGDDFSYYRLEYGQGLNPQAWVQIGGNVSNPVNDGFLAEWNTQGLSGLYALRLVVVRGDQRLESAVVAVTIE
jgi:membrane peptidoglycan carboxypeptidase